MNVLELSEQEIIRRNSMNELRAMGIEPYPAAEYVTNAFSTDIKAEFNDDAEPRQVSVAGRIMSRRIMGKASFIELQDSKGRIQVYITRDDICPDEDKEMYNTVFKRLLDLGDFIGIEGFVFRTQMGEISIHAKKLTVLAKSIKPLPIVAITTTAGTGSETDAGGVITNEDTNEKTPVKGPSLFPVLAIIDPELMATVPPKFTAYQGFDALFHNIEGYLANKANLMSEMVALEAISQISAYLPTAVQNGIDMKARERVAFGNYLGGLEMCLSSNMSEHSLEHALSAYHQALPHGAGLIMISLAYFSHMIDIHVCDDRFIILARHMGRPDAAKPEDFLDALKELQEKCGVANLKMSDYGISPDEFHKMAHNAKTAMAGLFMADRMPMSEEDCVAIYQASYR